MDQISPNSEAIILLTSYFNKGDMPLTVTEYSKFAQWLFENKKEPSQLMGQNSSQILSEWSDPKISYQRIESLLNRGNAMAISLEKWGNAGIWIMTRADIDYPQILKDKLKQKAPPILYGSGNKKILNTTAIAVIGSRDANEQDLDFTFKLGMKIANCGYSVVSGGAKGIDEYSMQGSIEAGGTTIGVLADSLLQKSLSKKYREAIINNNLVLISPFYPDAKFSVGNAMGRNKYIYTLGKASIVVHSGLNGGTWEGAKESLKNKWGSLFVKYNDDKKSGNSDLLNMGGLLLDSNILSSSTLDNLLQESVSVSKKSNISLLDFEDNDGN